MGGGLRRCARMLLGLSVVASTVVVVTPGESNAAPSCVTKSPYRLPATKYPNANLDEFGIPKMQAEHLTGAGVKVAVIDSGITVQGERWQGAVLRGGTSLVGGNAYVDNYGHGTAVASIIGARQPKGAAPIGVAPGALLLPIKVYDKDPHVSVATLAKAIVLAAKQHAKVISISLATPTDDPALRSAVQFAEKQDAVVVAAAGDQRDIDASNKKPLDKTKDWYPAGDPGVLGVAATGTKEAGTEGAVNGASYHGPQVQIAAPGAESYFVDPQGRDCVTPSYPYTSFSTPYVAGVAALLRQAYPKENEQQIVYRIEESALRPQQDKRNDVSGWGVIQPFTALTMALDPDQPGPPFPGSSAKQMTSTVGTQHVGRSGPLFQIADPRQEARSKGLWWGLAGVVLAAVAMICRPLVRRRIAESHKEPAVAGRRRAG